MLFEVLAQAILVAFTLWLAFGEFPEFAGRYLFMLFVPMIWIVLRFGVRGAIWMNVCAQTGMVITLWIADHANSDPLIFQSLLLVVLGLSLACGVVADHGLSAARQLKDRDEELAATLKLAASGELAGALAHELGHPLGAISNYASALIHQLRRTPHTNEATLEIGRKLNSEIGRAMDTLHRLRDFFRTGGLTLKQAHLGDLARGAIALCNERIQANSIGARITTRADVRQILCDHVQIRAVVYNLVVNAIDAMKAISPNDRILEITARSDATMSYLDVEDSGPGISDDVADHLFEPFVTTKKDGLGLGLAMCGSVVRAHGGRISFGKSRLGGAIFTIGLPFETG